MTSLAPLLSTKHFPSDEVSRLIDDVKHPQRPLVLSAVRAESEPRFLEALAAFFATIDWSSVANAEYGYHPGLASMLGAARNESATDHLAAVDLVRLCKMADAPDAAFALDVVRAIELDDAAAGARVAERVAAKLRAEQGMLSAPDNAVGGLRTAGILRKFAGDTDEAQLRGVAKLGRGSGAWAAYVAASIAASRGITLPEDVVSLQDSRRLCARIMMWLAYALDPALGQEVLELVVAEDWHNGDLEVFDLPWSRAVETVKGGKVAIVRQLGAMVLKASGPAETYSGPPTKRAIFRISVKRHPNEQKAGKELDKAAKEPSETITFQQADLDARLHHHARFDDGRERVAELLRRGASPNGYVDPQMKTTSLHRATMSADCGDIVRRLIAAGADVSALAGGGASPLDSASGGAAANALAAERLVAAGARCNTNPLFHVAEYGYHRVVPALVRGGADPNATRDGKTPIDIALEKRHLRTAVALGYRP